MAETWLVARVCDLRSFEVCALALGELRDAYKDGLLIGSDDGCDLVLDASAVEPRHARVWAGEEHDACVEALCPEVGRFRVGAQTIPVGEQDTFDQVDAFRVGCFTVTLREMKRSELGELVPSSGFDARVGGRRSGVPSMLAPDSTGPSELEARIETFHHTLATMCLPPRAPSVDQAKRFATTALKAHFDRLSQATTPRAALSPGQVIVVQSTAELLTRWHTAWTRAEQNPFRSSDWAHVHRVHALAQAQRTMRYRLDPRRWTATTTDDGTRLSEALWHFERDAGPRLTGDSATYEPLTATLHALCLAHIHALWCGIDDNASPWLPLLTLWEKGFWPFALPAGGTLIWCASAEGDVPLPALTTPAPTVAPVPRVGKVQRTFHEASSVLLGLPWLPVAYSPSKPPRPPTASGSVPAGARLELLETSESEPNKDFVRATIPLRETFHLENLRTWAESTVNDVTLIFVDGTFWLTPTPATTALEVNDHSLVLMAPHPLFDGDVVGVRNHGSLRRYRLRYSADADCDVPTEE